jgi:NADH-quinone oxidoreductase subunit J
MSGPLAAFYAVSAVMLTAALGVVLTRNVMHAVLLQLLVLVAVGGVYVLLQAEFVALVQILVYAGAVTTMLLFALMLTDARTSSRALDFAGRRPALLVAGAFGALLLGLTAGATWRTVRLRPPLRAGFGHPPGGPRRGHRLGDERVR